MNENEDLMNTEIAIGDESVSWGDLSEVPMDEVDPFRGFTRLPKGVYIFQVKASEMGYRHNIGEDQLTRGILSTEYEVLEVKRTRGFDGENEDLVGASHYENVMIFNAERDLGKVMAVMVDSGFYRKGSGITFGAAFRKFGESGVKFEAAINHRKDRNDPDKFYPELDLNTIKSLRS